MLGILLGGGTVFLIVLGYVAMYPEKAERIAGWIFGAAAHIWRRADRAAVAFKVQGEVNSARAALLKDAPEDVLEGRLKLEWTDVAQAEATIRGGDVVVFMGRSARHHENLANAVMAYLPKAVLPRARRYVDAATMRSADLILAKSVLAQHDDAEGVLGTFFEKHLDPVRSGSEEVRDKLVLMDDIDVHGWLLRVLLVEYRRLGDMLYPGECTAECLRDGEEMASWMHQLATRKPGNEDTVLTFEGRFLRVAFIFVANKYKLLEHGTEPYRKAAKRYIYTQRFDAVYLMGRDDNIPAVKEIADTLGSDARISGVKVYDFRLRPDFSARHLPRERGIIACLRRRDIDGREVAPPEDLDDGGPELEVERHVPGAPGENGAATP